MGREIKFRAKARFSGTIGSDKWIYSSLMRLDAPTHRLNLGGLDCDIDTLGQFTGLHDMNGKEIYEGDIVIKTKNDCSKCIDENVCDDGKCPTMETVRDTVSLDRFRYWLKNESFGYEGENLTDPCDCKVIGNIHENPELLK